MQFYLVGQKVSKTHSSNTLSNTSTYRYNKYHNLAGYDQHVYLSKSIEEPIIHEIWSAESMISEINKERKADGIQYLEMNLFDHTNNKTTLKCDVEN